MDRRSFICRAAAITVASQLPLGWLSELPARATGSGSLYGPYMRQLITSLDISYASVTCTLLSDGTRTDYVERISGISRYTDQWDRVHLYGDDVTFHAVDSAERITGIEIAVDDQPVGATQFPAPMTSP